MSNISYQMEISVRVRSKRKWHIPLPFLEGDQIPTSFEVRNVGQEPFPGGRAIITVTWPNGIPVITETPHTDEAQFFELSLFYNSWLLNNPY